MFAHRVPRSIRSIGLALFGALAFAATRSQAESNDGKAQMPLRVVDEQGRPVAKFDVCLASTYGTLGEWVAGIDGQAQIGPALKRLTGVGSEDPQVVVRAEGFASALVSFHGHDYEKLVAGRATVSLGRGELVLIVLRVPQQMRWPDGLKPEVFFDALRTTVWQRWEPAEEGQVADSTNSATNLLGAEWPQPGTLKLRLSADTPPIRLAVHSPGFLRCFDHGPLRLADFADDRLEIEIPRPGKLMLSFQPGALPANQLPFESATFSIHRRFRVLRDWSSTGSRPKRRGSRTSLPTWRLAPIGSTCAPKPSQASTTWATPFRRPSTPVSFSKTNSTFPFQPTRQSGSMFPSSRSMPRPFAATARPCSISSTGTARRQSQRRSS